MSILDKIFKDSDGKIVIVQFPNAMLLAYVASLMITKLTEGSIRQFFEILGFGSLFVFAWLELFEGVNYFRRALGLAVMIFLMVNRIG